MESLTKENFWDEMEQKYPKAMSHFKQWVDKYKSEHNWTIMFHGNILSHIDSDTKQPVLLSVPKYHELPIAMQFGIFNQYAAEAVPKAIRSILYLQNGFIPAVKEQIESMFVFQEENL